MVNEVIQSVLVLPVVTDDPGVVAGVDSILEPGVVAVVDAILLLLVALLVEIREDDVDETV